MQQIDNVSLLNDIQQIGLNDRKDVRLVGMRHRMGRLLGLCRRRSRFGSVRRSMLGSCMSCNKECRLLNNMCLDGRLKAQ